MDIEQAGREEAEWRGREDHELERQERMTHVCPECDGSGVDPKFKDSAWPFPCANCAGKGALDEHGEPIQLENDQ